MEDKTAINTPPPPPSEVKIRTMRSDIESMMQSGGGAPSYQTVSVEGLSMDKKFKPPTNFVTAPMPTPGVIQRPATENVFPAAPVVPERKVIGEEVTSRTDLIPKLIVGLVALAALAVVGYFAYTIFK